MGIDMIGPSRNSAHEMFDGLCIPPERLQERRIRVVDPGMIRRKRKGLVVAGRRGVEVASARVDGAQAPMGFGSVLVNCDRLAEVAFRIVEPVGKPSVVIASYGFTRQIIYKWLREAGGKGRGLRALISRKGTGRPRTLTPKQEQQLFRWINGKDPRQHGFDFGMWTRLVVRKLITDKFEANLGVTAVGKLLAKLGLTPQKPEASLRTRSRCDRSVEN
jgi:transposase